MKKKRTKKNYNQHKHAMKLLKGLQMNWSVKEPLNPDSEIHSFSRVTHKNQIHNLMIKEILAGFMAIKDKQRLRYRVDVDCHFEDDFGVNYSKGREMLIEGVISQADGAYFQAVRDILAISNMNHYKITTVKIEVLGQGHLDTKDFKESA